MQKYLRFTWIIFWKDLQIEFRTKESLSAIIIFSLAVIIILYVGLNPQAGQVDKMLPALYWITLTFAGILRLNRTYENEKDDAAWKQIILVPVDRSAIFLAKMLSNFLIFILLQLFLLPLFLVFFNLEADSKYLMILAINSLSLLGFSALGSAVAAISMNLKMKEIMLPVLLLPLLTPLLIGSVEAANAILLGNDFFTWVKVILAFDIIYISVSLLLFEYII